MMRPATKQRVADLDRVRAQLAARAPVAYEDIKLTLAIADEYRLHYAALRRPEDPHLAAKAEQQTLTVKRQSDHCRRTRDERS